MLIHEYEDVLESVAKAKMLRIYAFLVFELAKPED